MKKLLSLTIISILVITGCSPSAEVIEVQETTTATPTITQTPLPTQTSTPRATPLPFNETIINVDDLAVLSDDWSFNLDLEEIGALDCEICFGSSFYESVIQANAMVIITMYETPELAQTFVDNLVENNFHLIIEDFHQTISGCEIYAYSFGDGYVWLTTSRENIQISVAVATVSENFGLTVGRNIMEIQIQKLISRNY